MDIQEQLFSELSEAFQSLFGEVPQKPPLNLQKTKKEFEGDLTFVTFPYGRLAKMKPDQLAEKLGEWLKEKSALVSDYNVVKGFLNLSLKDEVWLEVFGQNISMDAFGQFEDREETVMVEYSSPNTNKPLHLGHLRNIFLGSSVSALLEKVGYQVVRANLVNDRGIHICKSMLAYQKFGNDETPETSGIKGDKLVGHYYVVFDQENKKAAETEGKEKQETSLMQAARRMLQDWEKGDPKVVALWKKMNGWVLEGHGQTYERMGVAFDKYYYESDTYLLGKDIVTEGLEKEVFYQEEDSSVWIDLSNEKLDKKLVQRSDGTSLYITQDMGTADLKAKDYPIKRSIYVVGNEQDYHFQVLFKVMGKLGRDYAPGMHHLSYGMVDLPEGKMKSREGTVVDADDLMAEMVEEARSRSAELGKIDELEETERQALYEMLGIGAVKYFLLKVEPKKNMLFDPKESIDLQGNTATFVQYTHARCRSVLRRFEQKLAEMGKEKQEELVYPSVLQSLERELIMYMGDYPTVLQEAAESYSPSLVLNYVYDLAKLFNKFYAELSILNADSPQEMLLRANLTAAVAKLIKEGMGLLGIGVPEQM